jgi:hypothetical protein
MKKFSTLSKQRNVGHKKVPDYKDSSASAKNSVIPVGMPESRAMDGNYIWHPCPI